MARLKGQGEGKNRMREMDTVRGSRKSTKESREEDVRVKGTYLERKGRKREGRSVEEMNRKDDRSEGYHAHGFHR